MNSRNLILAWVILCGACGPSLPPPGPLPTDDSGKACPVGTTIDYSDQASSECSGKVGVAITDQSGEVSGFCKASQGRAFKCVPIPGLCDPYGIRTITHERAECRDAVNLTCPPCHVQDGNKCIPPAACGQCATRDSMCNCITPVCPRCQKLTDSCQCDRAHSVCNCDELDSCNERHDGPGCSGRANACRDAGCWDGTTDC